MPQGLLGAIATAVSISRCKKLRVPECDTCGAERSVLNVSALRVTGTGYESPLEGKTEEHPPPDSHAARRTQRTQKSACSSLCLCGESFLVGLFNALLAILVVIFIVSTMASAPALTDGRNTAIAGLVKYFSGGFLICAAVTDWMRSGKSRHIPTQSQHFAT